MAALRDLQLDDTAPSWCVLYATAALRRPGRCSGSGSVSRRCVGALVATAYLAVAMPLARPGDAVAGNPCGTFFTAGFLVRGRRSPCSCSAWTVGLLVRSIRDSREVRRREDVANRERALVE